jgi:hypothetical protein
MRNRPGRGGTGRPSSKAEGTGDGQGGVPAAGAGPAADHLAAALTGLREPIVVLLLIIGFMSWISGKPLDGLLIILAGVGLAWDAGRRSRQTSPAVAGPAEAGAATASPVEASAVEVGPAEVSPAEAGPAREDAVLTATAAAPPHASVTAAGAGGPPTRAGRRRPALLAAGLAGGVLYAVVVGSFSRYSWPATVAVAGLGMAVVAIGWRGPRHTRPAQPGPPLTGLVLWGVLAVACCLWELWSLLEQPNLATSSYAHPTISTLTDPVLSTWAGRSVVLAAWLGLGWFLVER